MSGRSLGWRVRARALNPIAGVLAVKMWPKWPEIFSIVRLRD